MKKLTESQQKVLDEMRGGAKAYYMPYIGTFRANPYWFIDTDRRHCTRQIEALIKLGLVEITQSSYAGKTAAAKNEPAT